MHGSVHFIIMALNFSVSILTSGFTNFAVSCCSLIWLHWYIVFSEELPRHGASTLRVSDIVGQFPDFGKCISSACTTLAQPALVILRALVLLV